MIALLALALLASRAGELQAPATAEICGRCHRTIHEAWKISSHARAAESRLFQDVLEMAEAEGGAGARRLCLSCHAPIAVHGGDMGMVKKVSWEGVTCDFCHSIREVTWAANPKATVLFSTVRSGTIKEALSGAHRTAYSSVHSSSAVCAPCHDYRNSQGFPVLTTFTEWKATAHAAQGHPCQSCHMPRIKGVNLHQMPGSHSLEHLVSALKAQMYTAREGDRLNVTVDVANHRAGHYLPTGSPLRQIVLEVRAGAGREERVYTRRIADAQGKPIQREDHAFLKAAKVVADSRLAPG